VNVTLPIIGLIALLALASPTIAAIYLAVKLNRRRVA
jgi:hypothetical protein